MKNKPLVSVIITNYNYGRYITKAIESVISQTYSNIELIIINDGSTDDSDEVIKKAISKKTDRKIRYINRENKGVVYTRNEGMDLARGKYITYLDADDYFNRTYISKSYKVAVEHDADVVYPNWHFVGEWLGRPDTDFPEFSPELLQLHELHCTPASLIRKDAVKNHRFETEAVAEDWDFFIGLSLAGAKFKIAKDNYINYRIRKGTRGSKNDPKEDTRHFVNILTKHKKIHGDKVIDPARLVKIRHPNIFMRVLKMRYPRVVYESMKKDGSKATARKVARKLMSRNQILWKTLGYARNKKYKKITESFDFKSSPNTKLAVVVHLYYPDVWPIISKKLSNINIPFDLFVSVQERDKGITLDRVSKYHKITNIAPLPNRGRDVLPFFMMVEEINKEKQYKYLLKLHSKKSLHRADGSEWLDSLLTQLIPGDISKIVSVLEKPDTGAIGPADHVVSLSRYMGDNRVRIATILMEIAEEKVVKQIMSAPSKYPFFGGTMFWCRTDYISALTRSGMTTPADFDTERGQVDGTAAHAIERILGRALHVAIARRMYVVDNSIVSELPEKTYTASYKHVG